MFDLPYLTSGIPPVSARIKQLASDFIVEEVPYYLPQGAGEHCYLFVEKEGLTTNQMIDILSRQLAVNEQEIGVAGLKDARALTRQWISIRSLPESALGKFSHPRIRIVKVGRHKNKLRIGHLKGNHFKIRLRDVAPEDVPRAREVLDVLERRGTPNYFGEQRFGAAQNNHRVGKDLFEGKAAGNLSRKMKYFCMASYQSYIFNRCLAKRLETFDKLYDGDLAFKHENGAVFRVENPEQESPRLDEFQISPTGPIFGPKMPEAGGAEQELEGSVLKEEGISQTLFSSPFRDIELTGERRPYRFPIRDLAMNYMSSVLELSFFLPKGCYATALLREILKGRLNADKIQGSTTGGVESC